MTVKPSVGDSASLFQAWVTQMLAIAIAMAGGVLALQSNLVKQGLVALPDATKLGLSLTILSIICGLVAMPNIAGEVQLPAPSFTRAKHQLFVGGQAFLLAAAAVAFGVALWSPAAVSRQKDPAPISCPPAQATLKPAPQGTG